MTHTLVVLLTVALTFGFASFVLADGGGGGGEAATTPSKPVDPDFSAGVKAIKANQFAAAIPLFENVIKRDGKNADAWNWLAYATRKNGNPAASIPIYEKALAIDPKHRGAHEYIGEAYLMLGDVARAKDHLATLNSLCTFSCSEYRDLKRAVERHERGAKR